MNPFDKIRAERDESRRELESLRNAVFELCGHLPGVSCEEQVRMVKEQLAQANQRTALFELVRVALGAATQQEALEAAETLRVQLEEFNSPTGRIVLWFAGEMERQLALPKNRAKGNVEGWRGTPPAYLQRLASREMAELREAMDAAIPANNSPEALLAIMLECADVANFAMMIADQAKEAMGRNDGAHGVTRPTGNKAHEYIALKQKCVCGAEFDMMVESSDWCRLKPTLEAWNERHKECRPDRHLTPALSPIEAERVATELCVCGHRRDEHVAGAGCTVGDATTHCSCGAFKLRS